MVKATVARSFLIAGLFFLGYVAPAFAQEGQVLTELENQVSAAAKGWETTIMDAAKSLFWILATIEIGIAAVWLAIQSASLDSWFAELVRRIMFVGFFAFVLTQGPTFARAVVDSLFQIGAGGGSASPAEVFDAGIRVASQMSQQAQFGVFEDNALAIAAVLAMGVVVICFSLVAAIFVSVMVEMYVGLLAGMIMLGLGGSSFTKDFAVRYLVYAFGVGMKLMALVMIAKIGSQVLLGLANAPTASSDQFVTTLAIAGISVVVFIIAMYVPNIIQGVVQGASVTGGMETIRHGGQAASFAAGAGFLAAGAAGAGFAAAQAARAGGSSVAGAALRGIGASFSSGAQAAGLAAKEKAIGSPGAYAGSILGLANAKLDEQRSGHSGPKPPPERNDKP
ncbi:P-type conjugative transfer protein TrbL [Agrobacterium tumefaciens]|uniref:Riorf124 protein n=2 Tax=Rhizobium/Agrobacterium group TaxID=227290 RepID=Q9F5C8_RHIRH|nr:MULTISPECIES: P-type conjugative transfer protein TrbL [Rhizobium/Agrobacterium group]ASK43013.1 P-type conjugative transfer protein TrbL [Rhizobium rhizogenes]MCZ7976343.1 P-type conjugative transfer protein TrbL [Agrobacterium salinitolerans]MDA5243231.1 P-type conjugative transfer protein TrbL [Agrobacterium sp. MAFF310724]MDA5247587.1 P-type conjugative transfer protein TrbL [Agrobacterium sp. MAFF210268]TRB03262.1 P-type conjugative transfer protein TrbL [Agrobacterium tumefaciens]